MTNYPREFEMGWTVLETNAQLALEGKYHIKISPSKELKHRLFEEMLELRRDADPALSPIMLFYAAYKNLCDYIFSSTPEELEKFLKDSGIKQCDIEILRTEPLNPKS